MSSKNNTHNFFNDDFEVTYEDDPVFHYEETNPDSRKFKTIDLQQAADEQEELDKARSLKSQRRKGDETILMSPIEEGVIKSRSARIKEGPATWEEEGSGQSRRRVRHQDAREERDESPDRSQTQKKVKKGGRRMPNVLSPVKTTAKYGTKAIYKTASFVLRIVSLLLILGTAGYLAVNFWKGSAPYGDPATAVAQRNYVLAAYAAVAAFFLVFELISFLWALTRARGYDRNRSYKIDVGRGMFSFLFIYVCSYLAFLTNRFVPESPAPLTGIKGALEVFGSMHNALFGLCLAGVITCLIRKYAK